MNEFEFTLKFAVPELLSSDTLEERLYNAGCDDAILGLGQRCRVVLNFIREATSAEEAVASALSNVLEAIPEATLYEAGPDLVGVSDIARLLNFSRQNTRKLIQTHSATFPIPVHEGHAALWHLADVLEWFKTHQNRAIEPGLLEIAQVSMGVNASREAERLSGALIARLKPITARLRQQSLDELVALSQAEGMGY